MNERDMNRLSATFAALLIARDYAGARAWLDSLSRSELELILLASVEAYEYIGPEGGAQGLLEMAADPDAELVRARQTILENQSDE